MRFYYSPSRGAIYDTDFIRYVLPVDAIAISDARRNELLAGQESGKQIAAGPEGDPILVDQEPPSIEDQRALMVLTNIQFAKACFASGLMTGLEAEEWVANGALPSAAETALNSISDETARAVARIEFRGARIIERNNPFIGLLQAALELTDEQVDDLFEAGAAL